MQNTIFALSTIFGKSGIAVFRISGAQALEVVKKLGVEQEIIPRKALFSKIFHPHTKELLDEALIIYFKAPHSFTGEDVVEIHTHGSLAVIKDITKVLNEFEFLRIAEKGEFSKRAFINEKLDLTKAEGLADLIEAETSEQRRLSLEQLSGVHEGYYESLRKDAVRILSRLEALIDYPEDDLPLGVLKQADSEIKELILKISKYLEQQSIGELIQNGFEVAILGCPNVGKSSLLNAIARQDIAIVSEVAGTTRDVITVKVDLKGYAIIFKDTAGIRDATDIIEKEGVKRAKQVRDGADICIYVLDPTSKDSLSILNEQNTNVKGIFIINKMDLVTQKKLNSLKEKIAHLKPICISANQGIHVDGLLKEIYNYITSLVKSIDGPLITRERYCKHLRNSQKYLEQFTLHIPLDIATEYIRLAVYEIGRITGKTDIEEVLDEIFSTFCIGK